MSSERNSLQIVTYMKRGLNVTLNNGADQCIQMSLNK